MILFILAGLLPGPFAVVQAESDWHARTDGCWEGYYAFWVTFQGGEPIHLHWESGPDSGTIYLHPNRLQHLITTIDPNLTIGGRHIHNGAHCLGSRVNTPVYLIAALDVDGGTWVCNGSAVATTPGERLRWHDQTIPVTVLILSSYLPPEACHVAGAAPAWYVDYRRYTCLAFLGEDRDCPGEAHYH